MSRRSSALRNSDFPPPVTDPGMPDDEVVDTDSSSFEDTSNSEFFSVAATNPPNTNVLQTTSATRSATTHSLSPSDYLTFDFQQTFGIIELGAQSPADSNQQTVDPEARMAEEDPPQINIQNDHDSDEDVWETPIGFPETNRVSINIDERSNRLTPAYSTIVPSSAYTTAVPSSAYTTAVPSCEYSASTNVDVTYANSTTSGISEDIVPAVDLEGQTVIKAQYLHFKPKHKLKEAEYTKDLPKSLFSQRNHGLTGIRDIEEYLKTTIGSSASQDFASIDEGDGDELVLTGEERTTFEADCLLQAVLAGATDIGLGSTMTAEVEKQYVTNQESQTFSSRASATSNDSFETNS